MSATETALGSPDPLEYQRFTLADGVELAYLDCGPAVDAALPDLAPIVLIAGWSQSVAQFRYQLPTLSNRHRVLALDMRGHGESSKPLAGYRVSRLAADLREFIKGLGLSRVSFVAHSIGATVVWSYLDTYGQAGIERLVFIDEGACVVAKPTWSEEERRLRGAAMSVAEYADFYARIKAAATQEHAAELVRGLFTSGVDPAELDWVARENLKLPRQAAADLMWESSTTDWSDVFAAIRRPTLMMGAEESLFHPDSQRWIASQIPGAVVDICPAAERGSHFMFIENPERFNTVVLNFLSAGRPVL
jgi:non-heme chloroperoxidase